MAEITEIKNAGRIQATRKRHPRIESFRSTFNLFLKNKLALAGFIITLTYGIIAILDWAHPSWLGIANINNAANFTPGGASALSLAPPTAPTLSHGWWYWFGTTEYQIPILPVMLAALKFDIAYSVLIVVTGMLIGVIIGTISGYLGGAVDETVMRITDIFFSVPSLILVIAITFVLGESLFFVVIALIIIWWPIYARLTRGLTLSVRSMKYIEAATASGSSKIRTIFSHIIPNVLSPTFVQFSLDLGSIVLIFASFDYIGLNKGNPLLPELGQMINWGQTFFTYTTPSGMIMWWPVVIPGIFLLIFTVAVNLMGDGLRDVLDPRLRR